MKMTQSLLDGAFSEFLYPYVTKPSRTLAEEYDEDYNMWLDYMIDSGELYYIDKELYLSDDDD